MRNTKMMAVVGLMAVVALGLAALWMAPADLGPELVPEQRAATPPVAAPPVAPVASPIVRPQARAPAALPTAAPIAADPGPGPRGVMAGEASMAPEPMPEPEELPVDMTVWPATRAGIDGAMKEVLKPILGCYQEALDEIEGLEGGISLDFTVGEEEGVGRITRMGVTSSTVDDAPMEDCIMDVIEQLQFDPPDEGELTVSYPFEFTPG